MIYTRELLEKRRNIHDCRSILYDMGGTPSNKNKEKLIDEILKIQSGEMEAVRTTRRPNSKDFKYREDEFTPIEVHENPDIDSVEPNYCGDELDVVGVLDVVGEYGFLRGKDLREDPASDVYVARAFIREHNLKSGDLIVGKAGKRRDLSVNSLSEVILVNGKAPNSTRVSIDEAPASYPRQKFNIGGSIETRIADIFAPIGKGQRCVISASSKSGTTTFITKLATDFSKIDNVEVVMLLICERPEEAYDMASKFNGVYFTTFEDDSKTQVKVASLAVERAKRLAEDGKDAVLIVDSLTKLVKACSELDGGGLGEIKLSAISLAKSVLASARCLNEGSLTVIATLNRGVSPLHEAVYEELKETANSEIALSKSVFDGEIFPAFNLMNTQTSKSEYLVGEEGVKVALKLKRQLEGKEIEKELLPYFLSTNNNLELIAKLLK